MNKQLIPRFMLSNFLPAWIVLVLLLPQVVAAQRDAVPENSSEVYPLLEPPLPSLPQTALAGCKNSPIDFPTISILTERNDISCYQPYVALKGNLPEQFDIYWWESPNGILTFDELLTASAGGTYKFCIKPKQLDCAACAHISISDTRVYPKIITVGDEITCQKPIVSIHTAAMPARLMFDWRGENGFFSSTASPMVSSPGKYYLTATEPQSGCITRDSVSILNQQVYPSIEIITRHPSDTSLRAIWLDATSSNSGQEFICNWSSTKGKFNGKADSFAILVSEPDVYNLMVVNTLNGCITSTSVTVEGKAVEQAPLTLKTSHYRPCLLSRQLLPAADQSASNLFPRFRLDFYAENYILFPSLPSSDLKR